MMAPGYRRELEERGSKTVSQGTLNLCCLYSSFRAALLQMDGDADHLHNILGLTQVSGEALTSARHPFWRTAVAQHFVFEVLQSALQEIAPEGFWFGADQNDGVIFGFWRIEPDE